MVLEETTEKFLCRAGARPNHQLVLTAACGPLVASPLATGAVGTPDRSWAAPLRSPILLLFRAGPMSDWPGTTVFHW